MSLRRKKKPLLPRNRTYYQGEGSWNRYSSPNSSTKIPKMDRYGARFETNAAAKEEERKVKKRNKKYKSEQKKKLQRAAIRKAKNVHRNKLERYSTEPRSSRM